jgi:hypothetical protein
VDGCALQSVLLATKVVEGQEHFKPAYVKFHHRGAALHAIAAYHWKHGLALPLWFVKFGTLKAKWEGELSQADLVALGLAAAASLQHGTVKILWYESVLLAQRRGAAFSLKMASKLAAVCPEHIAKVRGGEMGEMVVVMIMTRVMTMMQLKMKGRLNVDPRKEGLNVDLGW